VILAVALLTALSVFKINILPAVTLAVSRALRWFWSAKPRTRRHNGFYIVLEDQYAVGDTIQIGDYSGRVEYLTLRRTVIRDARGALVTIANGEIRTVSQSQPRLVASVRGRFARAGKPNRGKRYRLWRPRRPLCEAIRPGRKHWWTGRGFLVCKLRRPFVDGTIAGEDRADTAG